MNDKFIPASLRMLSQWILWRLEKGKKGKMDKNPYSVRYLEKYKGFASTIDPDTWTEYEEAIRRYRESLSGSEPFSGIGFVVTLVCGLVFIDIDHCIDENGVLSDTAQDILNAFKQKTFCEVSQSGTGLHIFAFGSIPKGFKNSVAGVEMYVSARYCAITGNALPGWNVEPVWDQDAINYIFEKYKTKEKKAKVQKIERDLSYPAELDEGKILQLILKDHKANMLYSGQWEGVYPSQSEADGALCMKLAFYCGKDPAMMDRLFRSSALMRDKWDQVHDGIHTYGEMTIAGAIGKQAEVYSPSRVNQPEKGNSRDIRYKSLYAEKLNTLNNMEGDFLPMESFKAGEDTKLPEFNLEWLPDSVFRRYAQAICQELQVSTDMTAFAMITAVSASLQKRAEVCIKAGWYEPCTLYTAIVADPGERKSGVQRKIVDPFIQYEKNVNQERKESQRLFDREIEKLKERQKKLKRQKTLTEEEAEELEEIAVSLEGMEKPTLVRMQTDNATTEALYSLMAQNNECMSVFSSEGGIFKIAAGMYSDKKGSGGNVDVYLKAYDNDYCTYDRKTDRESITMYMPSLAILLFVQPQVIQEIMCNEEFKGRGFNQRFAYVFTHSLIGQRSLFTGVTDLYLKDQYQKIMIDFLTIAQCSDRQTIPKIRLSSEAMQIANEYFQQNEILMKERLKSVRGWASKSFGRMGRIALCLHAMKYASGFLQHEEIEPDTLRSAIAIEDYLIEHALYAFNGMGEIRLPRETEAIYILEKIQNLLLKEKIPIIPKNAEEGKITIPKQELWQACRGKFDTTRKMQRGLDELVLRNIIRIKKVQSGEPGRPQELIEVNPLYMEALPED
ncbi:MAG: DUF3987 domain-containing protein [Solobacterium sp.]|nr:DUF3987 domain-containing protein [Solobacterium sp.]